MSKRTLTLLLGLIVVTILLLNLAVSTKNVSNKPISKAPAPTPFAHTKLSLSPNPLVALNNSKNNLDVNIDTGLNKVSVVQIELSFDPLKTKNVSIIPSAFFDNPIVLLNEIDQKTGRISYALGITPGQKGKTGIGTIATISFTAVGQAGQSTAITFLPKTKVADQNIIRDSVLKSSQGTTIMFSQSSASTPTVSLSPINTGQY